MNITQRQEILDLLEKIEKFDLIGFLTSQGIDDLEKYQYADRSFLEISDQLRRMNEQLKSELNKRDFRFLPVVLNSNTEFGNINLSEDLNDLLSSLKVHGNEQVVVKTLDKLIFYQINLAFWDRSSINIHDSRNIDLKRRISEMAALEKTFKGQRESINQDSADIKDLIEKLKEGLSSIESNSSQIATNKTESDNVLTIIKRNLDDSNSIKLTMSDLEVKITESLNKVSGDINENSKKFNEIVNQSSSLEDELNKTIASSLKSKEKIDTAYNYIDAQKDQIEKMVGLATDGAIGYKFDERQKNIFKSNWFWKVAVPSSYVLAAIWVVIVFSVLKTKLDNEWLNLSINLAKTTPVWFLVAFCTNQYKKERDFEEEYAFKSAVAMTITSYTSLLGNDDVNSMKTKDQVLSKVLDNLYASPIRKEMERRSVFTARKKVVSEMASKSKELEEILKPVIELMKEIKK